MTRDWTALCASLRTGALERRDFLAAAAALGINGAIATKTFAAESPKRGGHLVMGINQVSTSDSLDPATWNAEFQYCTGLQLYDNLAIVDERMAVQPSLAESWEAKNNAREWVFKLRKGVTFHNGKSLTPADVIYSLNHHRGEGTKSIARTVLNTVTDIKQTGPNEITFILDPGNPDLPFVLAEWHMMIAPEGSKFDGVGTGAFVLESFEPGVRARTKRNKNDWRQDRGYVDSVETVGINDTNARLTALVSGSVHIINHLSVNAVAQLEKSSQIQLFNVSGGAYSEMVMLTDGPPYDNLDLRLAMKYAIDREAILKTVLRGYGKVGNDQPVPSYNPLYAADIPQRKYDPDKAKFHFKKAGYGGAVTLTTAEAASGGAVEAAQLFRESAAKCGIDLQINRVSNDGYYANVWQKVPFFASFIGGRPTADVLLTTFFSSASPFNESHWKSPKFDAMLAAARAETDAAKRKQAYHDLQFMAHEEAGNIIPVFQDWLDAGSRKVKGFVPSPFQQMSGLRAAEKVWLDG